MLDITEFNNVLKKMYAYFHKNNDHVSGFRLSNNQIKAYITYYYENDDEFDGSDHKVYTFEKPLSYTNEELQLLENVCNCVLTDYHENRFSLCFIRNISIENDEFIVELKQYKKSRNITSENYDGKLQYMINDAKKEFKDKSIEEITKEMETELINEIEEEINNEKYYPAIKVQVKGYMVKNPEFYHYVYRRLMSTMEAEDIVRSTKYHKKQIEKLKKELEDFSKVPINDTIKNCIDEATKDIQYHEEKLGKFDKMYALQKEIEELIKNKTEKELDKLKNEYMMKIHV